ncbi:MAG: patatin-like phospholipase family protein [Halobacteriaceae archaeon]
MVEETDETTVAIACQGGGSLTAYTAGVLKSVLTGMDEDERVVGFSGTSAGAICATLAWYGMLEEEPERAAEHLDDFWADVAASDPLDRMTNEFVVGAAQLDEESVPTPDVSPYWNPYARYGQRLLRRKIERQVDFDRAA